MSLETIIYFVALGFLGGVAYCLIWAESWQEVKTFKYSKRMILGAIAGFLYYFLHSDYNFPNLTLTFISGYFAVDFIEGIVERGRQLKQRTPT